MWHVPNKEEAASFCVSKAREQLENCKTLVCYASKGSVLGVGL